MLVFFMDKYYFKYVGVCLISVFMLFSHTLAHAEEPNWQTYEQLLKKYVHVKKYQGGTLHFVHYSQLKKDPRFQATVDLIADYPSENLKTKEERLAFYINAYNVLAMKKIIDHWPTQSIKKVGTLLTQVWDQPAGLVSQQTMSLRLLEDQIIRKMGEPRIHFAINCASISCPNLRREPYRAATLNQQLRDQTKQFLNDPYKGAHRKQEHVEVSKIFKWFANDFKSAGGTSQFIYHYRPEFNNMPTEAVIPYNWDVNGD